MFSRRKRARPLDRRASKWIERAVGMVLLGFQADGPGRQERINQALRKVTGK